MGNKLISIKCSQYNRKLISEIDISIYIDLCIIDHIDIYILFRILAVNLNKYIKELWASRAHGSVLSPISLFLISTTAYFPFNLFTQHQLWWVFKMCILPFSPNSENTYRALQGLPITVHSNLSQGVERPCIVKSLPLNTCNSTRSLASMLQLHWPYINLKNTKLTTTPRFWYMLPLLFQNITPPQLSHPFERILSHGIISFFFFQTPAARLTLGVDIDDPRYMEILCPEPSFRALTQFSTLNWLCLPLCALPPCH